MNKFIIIPAALSILALAGCGAQNTNQAQPSTTPVQTQTGSSSQTGSTSQTAYKVAKAEDTKNVAVSNDTFGPVVDVVHVGDTVTWTNRDNTEHQLVTYPDAPASFTVDIPANQTGTFTFTKPGVYRYYGKNFATYSKDMGDVSANKNSSAYPVPMRGVVVVLSANNSLPASSSPSVDIPDSTMAFTAWDLTVNQGTTVTWTDHDDMDHMVASVPGFVSKQTQTLTLKKDGGTGQLTFDQPGVYYYYCPMHAAWSSSTMQLTPQKSYGGFPFVMDGLIVVNGK